MEETNEENKKRIKLYYFHNNYYKKIYTNLAQMYYYGISGVVDRDYNKSLNIFNFLFKSNDILYGDERFSLQFIYYIHRNINY